MELDISEGVNPTELDEMATRFRRNFGATLTQTLQEHLNEVLGPDLRVGIRVEVESVALRKTS